MGWCASCAVDVEGGPIEMNGAGQLVKMCPKCSAPLAGEAPTASVGPGAVTEDGRAAAKRVPVAPAGAAPMAKVVQLPRGHAAPAPRAAARSATEIIDEARTQLASLDVEIPELEANLARARAHRKGLAKMIAAYDRGSKE